MIAEKRTAMAIDTTRTLLINMMDNPQAIIEMVVSNMAPEDVENKVYEILEYLEKTATEAAES